MGNVILFLVGYGLVNSDLINWDGAVLRLDGEPQDQLVEGTLLWAQLLEFHGVIMI